MINIDKTRDFVELIIGIDNIPVICKSIKPFSKYNVVKFAEPNGLVNNIRIVTTPDNGNRVFELIINQSSLPKKISGRKTLKLSDSFAAEIEIKTVNKPVEKESVNQTTTQQQPIKIVKRKFEVPYPIKFAAGVVAFFGVLEIGSALISKVVNKIK